MSIFQKRKALFGNMTPKNIAELKPWYLVYVDMICPYSSSIRQQQTGGAIIKHNVSQTCMPMIDPATGWIKNFKN